MLVLVEFAYERIYHHFKMTCHEGSSIQLCYYDMEYYTLIYFLLSVGMTGCRRRYGKRRWMVIGRVSVMYIKLRMEGI